MVSDAQFIYIMFFSQLKVYRTEKLRSAAHFNLNDKFPDLSKFKVVDSHIALVQILYGHTIFRTT